MATNIVYEDGNQIPANVSGVTGSGAGGLVQSGDPGVLGQLPFVALTDEGSDGMATIKTNGFAELVVDAEAAEVTLGALLYFDTADANKINNSSSGNVRFGYAWDSVANGEVATITVKIGY